MLKGQGNSVRALIVDDEPSVRRVVRRILENEGLEVMEAANGEEAISMAQTYKPDLIILDIDIPVKNGKEVIQELRSLPQTQMIPVIMLTANSGTLDKVTGFELGTDDYVTKPFEVLELQARVKGLLQRTQRTLSANPLTLLPGGLTIKAEVDKRIQQKELFAFLYIDIDHFKAFNDTYGYLMGNVAIQETASILLKAVESLKDSGGFVGHIGGDDFVAIVHPERAQELAQKIAALFDQKAPSFYKEDDRSKGYIFTQDRQGNKQQFPLMSLSIAIATNEKRSLAHYAKVVDVVSEIKHFLKSQKNRHGSAYLKDHRINPTGDAIP